MTNFPRRMGLPEEIEEIKRRLYEIERSIPESLALTTVTNASYTGQAAALRVGNVVFAWSNTIQRTSSNNTTFHVVISGFLPVGMRPLATAQTPAEERWNAASTAVYQYRINAGSGDLEGRNEAGAAGAIMGFTMMFRIPEGE